VGIIDKYGGGGCYIGKAVVVHIDFFTMPCDMQTVAEKRPRYRREETGRIAQFRFYCSYRDSADFDLCLFASIITQHYGDVFSERVK
jgi:hypothetical protein